MKTERLTKQNDIMAYVNCDNCPSKGSCNIPQSCLEALANKLAVYEDAEEQGRVVVLDRETALAIAAGWRAIRTTKRFYGASYVYDPIGEDGGPYEIPYVKAGEILRNIWDKYPLDCEKAKKAVEVGNGL